MPFSGVEGLHVAKKDLGIGVKGLGFRNVTPFRENQMEKNV